MLAGKGQTTVKKKGNLIHFLHQFKGSISQRAKEKKLCFPWTFAWPVIIKTNTN
jgi:hypothetical protein